MTNAAAGLLFTVDRLGVIMAPVPGNPHEAGGVLNPAGVAGPDGQYYLFPRLVAPGNYSRIGVARVRRDAHSRPVGVERLGLALEPAEPHEIVRPGIGGCEDPRIAHLAWEAGAPWAIADPPWAGVYVMTYTALGLLGPHVALATSRDLRTWTRHGLIYFTPEHGADFNVFANKDAMLLPEPVHGPDGQPCLALLHRPMYEMWLGFDGEGCVPAPPPAGVEDERASMWISYCPLGELDWLHGAAPARFSRHHLLAAPRYAWESYRIGGGTVPLRTSGGWVTFYHGVELFADGSRCYRTGALLLDRDDPRTVLARTEEPIFGPETPDEVTGVVGNVVFPTAVDQRDGGFDLYYGMADSRIGVARLTPGLAARAEEAA